MRTTYEPSLKAQLTLDESDRVRQITHLDAHWTTEAVEPRAVALAYLRRMSGLYGIPDAQLDRADLRASHWEPREAPVAYRLDEEKSFNDATTYGFVQTALNVPVWGAGLTVTVKHAPGRVLASTFTGQDQVTPKLPPAAVIERHQKVFVAAERARAIERLRLPVTLTPAKPSVAPEFVAGILMPPVSQPPGVRTNAAAVAPKPSDLIRGRFFVYRYDPAARLPQHADPQAKSRGEGSDSEPTLPLPPVPDSIKPGTWYLVSEITFEAADLVWLALVEVESNAVLYLRALASGVNGQVFPIDPISSSGNAANGPNQNNAVLNGFRQSVVLQNLDAPSGGTQSLRGARAAVQNVENPNVAAPTRPSGSDFNFNARTNDFAAVSAYYHVDRFFSVVESLGFPLGSYFDGTTFPISVDHRDFPPDGLTVNAHCIGNGSGGIGHVGYALGDLGDTANPIGRATDSRVTWHEVGGHGVLYEHVNFANFGFAHSAGDSLSIIFHDPDSVAPDRFRYAPWNPSNLRRADRTPAAGYAWGGTQDDGGYSSEEILETTLFRVYRSIGGDSTDASRRRFASRMAMWLILRAIATLTPATNPGNALGFANALIAADQINWTSEGVYGGAYGKVVRWSFERQGLYQPPGAPTPVSTAGAPPAADVYIDDGRGGQYPYQAVHWANGSVWNRVAADGLPGHQEPIIGATNHIYVKVKNRGTGTATNVRVRGFHTRPGAGLTWPNDFEALATASLNAGTIAGLDAEEKLVGPFAWTPNINAYGHDCLLMIASADGDPSNIDNFTVGETVPEWRLVPNDNNVGQRNVFPVAAASGEGLLASLQHIRFWVGNPERVRARMEIAITLPDVLRRRGWQLGFQGLDGLGFELASGERRELVLELKAGRSFTAAEVRQEATPTIALEARANGNLVGGMVYALDPDKERPANATPTLPLPTRDASCAPAAEALLHCLGLPKADVDCVRISKVSVDLTLKGSGCC